MGFGTQETSGLLTTYFKIEGLKKGSKEVYFTAKQKSGDSYVDLDVKPSFIEGTLKSVNFSEYEYEGTVYKQVKITLEDITDRCVLSMGFSSTAISILNSLAGCTEQIDKVKISVYMNKKGFPSVSVTINGEKSQWKWDYKKDLQTKVEVITNKKGEVVSTDKAELVEYLIKYFTAEEFQNKIANKRVEAEEHTADMSRFADTKGIDDPDDLPF